MSESETALQEEVARLVAGRDRLESDAAMQKAALEASNQSLIAQIEQDERAHSDHLKRLETALADSEQRVEAALERSVESGQVLEQRLEAFGQERDGFEAEIQRLKQHHEAQEASLNASLRGVEGQLSEALSRAASAEQAHGAAETARTEALGLAERARGEADSALGEVALASSEVERVRAELDRIRGESEAAREHVALREQQVSSLETEVTRARERLEASEVDYGNIFGQYTLQQTDLLNLEIDAKEAKQALAKAVDSQRDLLAEQAQRMKGAERAYTAIVDGLMDLVEAVPDRSESVFGMLSQLREVLDAGQQVVDSNRNWVELQDRKN